MLNFAELLWRIRCGSTGKRCIAASVACSAFAIFSLSTQLIPNAFAETISKREILEEEDSVREDHEEEVAGLTKIRIEGKNGVFTPSVIKLSVFAPVVFEFVAMDRDYEFAVKDTAIKYQLKKGSVTEVSLATLGKGDYTFVCGKKCSGTIHVVPEIDDDDEAEDEARTKLEVSSK